MDYQNHLEYLRCATVENTDAGPRFTWVDIPAEKFVIATWSPRTAIPGKFDPGFNLRNMGSQATADSELVQGTEAIREPSLFGTTHEGAEDIPCSKPETGEVLTGAMGNRSAAVPQVAMKKGLQKFFESGSIMVGPWSGTSR